MEKLDKELENRVRDIYPVLKDFIEFTAIYNESCDAGTALFNEYDQQCLERCLSIIEYVKNNL